MGHGKSCRGKLRHRANLTLSPFSVSVPIHGRRTETSTKRYPPGQSMQALTFVFAFVAVLALIGGAAMAGSPIRRQPARCQHQFAGGCRGWRVIDAAAVDGRRRLVLVAARQHRTSADDRRTDRYRRGIQYRTRHRRTGSDAATARRRGWRRTTATAAGCRCRIQAAAAKGDGSHVEPQLPEPPSRPARPSFADEARRPAPAAAERRSDPLTGFHAGATGRPRRAAQRADANCGCRRATNR